MTASPTLVLTALLPAAMPSLPTVSPQPLDGAPSAEDADRADVWGLLALLYIAPADAELLRHLGEQPVMASDAGVAAPPSPLQATWAALTGAARNTSVAAAREAFETLFGGIGQPAVYVYGSYYLAGALHEKPLARLRGDLQELSLVRRQEVGESEDHFAVLAEIMRFLIAGDDPDLCLLTRQRALFQAHIQPWGTRMCEAIAAHPAADFYSFVADFTREFLAVEQLGFDLLD
jgi:TorA maturation chaperone TorD